MKALGTSLLSLASKVAKSKRWPSTDTLATKSPPPPGNGVLWQPAQEFESGPEIRFIPRGNTNGSMLSESTAPVPLVCGRPAPSCRVHFALNSTSPCLMSCLIGKVYSSPSCKCLVTDNSWQCQYLRQKLHCFCMNPADFCDLKNPVVD